MTTTREMDPVSVAAFLALMQGGGGLADKSPSYIFEKLDMLTMPPDFAIARLDFARAQVLREWLERWGHQVLAMRKGEPDGDSGTNDLST